ncbi:histidinol dehydrogenase [Gynuella sunshinyii]|uniref:Histidinol dehydrogenase n=1 Tax=Gynuella sunshinyii YC6258 TaxID=1445510 RepID=A0A0C5VAX7_9GAMM|nr:histidinol dehydrogenase [Gynuella sunshinyii]AJQ96500.1 histidinol dehydrogenase [Gynuella sunshinyii YC6258]
MSNNRDLKIRRLNRSQADFDHHLDHLLAWESVSDPNVQATVAEIIQRIRTEGDVALVEYTNRFDRMSVSDTAELVIREDELQQALESIPSDQKEALELAAKRIRRFHERQKQSSWRFEEEDGTVLGQQVTALDRVGVYVPGGLAAYPSSVLMNVIPASVAGVEKIIMVTPTPGGEKNPLVLAAAAISGVDQVICIGGAQAVAALAYGTETVPAVDKIVGPGNTWVATAKSQVFGKVGIDMIAGPSEILVICDGQTDPEWIAMDLFSQAEHDRIAQSILISPSVEFLDQVEAAANRLLNELPRSEIIRASIEGRGAFIHVNNLEEAAELSNRIAPEHLELSVEDPEALLQHIRHAGAVFMGRYSAEALGDYCAGPNHVLPTSGTARFFSPLGVYDFQKKSSIIYFSAEGAREQGKVAAQLAYGEGLQAHALSASYRVGHNAK